MTKSRTPPNEYVVSWTNSKGERKKMKKRAMTSSEAKVMFLRTHMLATNVNVSRLWKEKPPKISSLFH